MYASNYIVSNPNTSGSSTNIKDLASLLISCWSPDGTNGRTMTATTNPSGQYFFPSYNYSTLFSGQIISINNQSGHTITIAVSNNGTNFCQIQNGSSYYSGTSTFTISNSNINTYVLTGGTFFVRIANLDY
jgi:hypothetical protein